MGLGNSKYDNDNNEVVIIPIINEPNTNKIKLYKSIQTVLSISKDRLYEPSYPYYFTSNLCTFVDAIYECIDLDYQFGYINCVQYIGNCHKLNLDQDTYMSTFFINLLTDDEWSSLQRYFTSEQFSVSINQDDVMCITWVELP